VVEAVIGKRASGAFTSKMNTRQFAAIRRQKQLRADESEFAQTPTITLSTLARAMGPLSPAMLTRLLAGHKHHAMGPRRSYQCAREQAIALLTDGTTLNPDAPLRSHERDAVKAMVRSRLPLPARSRALRANARGPHWILGGVRISMQPDVELDGTRGTGAAKIILTKERLPRGVGRAMASLLWHYRKNVLGIESTRRDHCIVFEPRLPWLHLPAPRAETQLRQAELACDIISALWSKI
jgi:hypothetical protein